MNFLATNSIFDVFMYTFNGVFPIIALILLGYILKIKGFLSEEFLKKGNSFVFKVCLPCLLFINIYSIKSFSEIDFNVVLYSEIAIVFFFIIGLLIVKMFIPDEKQKGVILQCVIRSNFAIIGLPLAKAFGGEAGANVAAILSAFSIPTFNILAVIALTMFIKSDEKKGSIKKTLINICKNPLILGVLSGLVVLGIRSLIPHEQVYILTETTVGESIKIQSETYKAPVWSLQNNLPFIFTTIKNISVIASPLALFILGGNFKFSAVKGMFKQISIGVVFRILIVPFIAIFTAVILVNYKVINFANPQAVWPAFIALFGSPVAVSSAIMAQDMDNDGTLAGQLVVWTSVLSIFTIFLLVMILGLTGTIAI